MLTGCESVFFFKQKTAYVMRISDWSSDVCSSDLSDIRAELASEIEDSSDGALTSDQADCVAGFLIEEIGEDKMAGVDFDADEPPEEVADEIIPAMMGAVAECEVSLGDLRGDGGDDAADKPSEEGDAKIGRAT